MWFSLNPPDQTNAGNGLFSGDWGALSELCHVTSDSPLGNCCHLSPAGLGQQRELKQIINLKKGACRLPEVRTGVQ